MYSSQEEDVTLTPAALEILTKIGSETSLRESLNFLPHEFTLLEDLVERHLSDYRLRDPTDYPLELGREET